MVRRAVHGIVLTLGLGLGLGLGSFGLAGCHAGSPELRVVGMHQEPRHDVVFVQVTNPANHVMRLTRLQYTFAAGGAKLSEGEVVLSRDVPAGETVVVEVPVDAASSKPMTLSGQLTTELNDIEQTFSVSAKVDPSSITVDDGSEQSAAPTSEPAPR